jgi:hypothetical protein
MGSGFRRFPWWAVQDSNLRPLARHLGSGMCSDQGLCTITRTYGAPVLPW